MKYDLKEYSNPNSPLHGEGYWIQKTCSKRSCNCTFHIHSSWQGNNEPKYCKDHAVQTLSLKDSKRENFFFSDTNIHSKGTKAFETRSNRPGAGLFGRNNRARRKEGLHA